MLEAGGAKSNRSRSRGRVDSRQVGSKIGQMVHRDWQATYRRHRPNGPGGDVGLLVSRAEGAVVFDGSGRRYLDFASGCQSPLGHNHPSMAGVLARLGHRPPVAGGLWPEAVELTELLAEVVPGAKNRRVLVCDSGREALAAAVRLAQQRTRRNRILYLADLRGDDVRLEQDVAAAVAHPLGPRLGQAARACSLAGTLLIDDETGIGPGLTGTMLAIEHSSVRADLYVLGNGWASGLPFGACVTGSSDLHWQDRVPVNPAGSAAAIETIRLLKAGLVEQGALSARLLEAELERAGLPWTLSGEGLVWTLMMEQGKGQASGFLARCLDLGLLCQRLGADSVGIRPPVVVAGAEIKQAVAVLRTVAGEFKRT
jgi:4-aminobutyrate aminotransferase-like enzyme